MHIIVELFISNSLGLVFKLQGALTSLPPHTHIRAMFSNACSDSAVSKYVLIWSVLKKWKKNHCKCSNADKYCIYSNMSILKIIQFLWCA